MKRFLLLPLLTLALWANSPYDPWPTYGHQHHHHHHGHCYPVVPEPATYGIIFSSIALVGYGVWKWRKRK